MAPDPLEVAGHRRRERTLPDVARIRMTAQYLRPRWRSIENRAVSAMAMTAIVPAWTGSETTRSATLGTEPAMLSATTGNPDLLELRTAFVMSPPMSEPGEHEDVRPRQVRDGPDGCGDLLLADERDRVHADALAPQVVPVGLGHGAQGSPARPAPRRR